jgi:hypothetical protein
MSDFTTISIKRETRDRLQRYGRKGESYEEILNRLLDLLKLYQEQIQLRTKDEIDDATKTFLGHIENPHIGFESEDEQEYTFNDI